MARIAGRIADGLISTNPKREIVAAYDGAGGAGKPRYIEVQVCWGRDPGAARRLVHELWPTSGLGGQLAQEIRRPADFEAAAEPITMEKSTKDAPVGPDPEPYVKAIQKCIDAGFDHVGLHQVGPDQECFLKFWEKEGCVQSSSTKRPRSKP